MSYIKLSELENDQFTIQEVKGFGFKKWDDVQKTMLFSKTYEQGYRKIWAVETSKGTLDLGSGQMATLLEKVCDRGSCDLIGKTFEVKTNGKTGMEIRYYFNVVKPQQEETKPYNANNENDDLPW